MEQERTSEGQDASSLATSDLEDEESSVDAAVGSVTNRQDRSRDDGCVPGGDREIGLTKTQSKWSSPGVDEEMDEVEKLMLEKSFAHSATLLKPRLGDDGGDEFETSLVSDEEHHSAVDDEPDERSSGDAVLAKHGDVISSCMKTESAVPHETVASLELDQGEGNAPVLDAPDATCSTILDHDEHLNEGPSPETNKLPHTDDSDDTNAEQDAEEDDSFDEAMMSENADEASSVQLDSPSITDGAMAAGMSDEEHASLTEGPREAPFEEDIVSDSDESAEGVSNTTPALPDVQPPESPRERELSCSSPTGTRADADAEPQAETNVVGHRESDFDEDQESSFDATMQPGVDNEASTRSDTGATLLMHQDLEASDDEEILSESSVDDISENDDHHDSDTNEIAVAQHNLLESSFDADMQSVLDNDASTSAGGIISSQPVTHTNDNNSDLPGEQEALRGTPLAEHENDASDQESELDEVTVAQHTQMESSFNADMQSDRDDEVGTSAAAAEPFTHPLEHYSDKNSEPSGDHERVGESLDKLSESGDDHESDLDEIAVSQTELLVDADMQANRENEGSSSIELASPQQQIHRSDSSDDQEPLVENSLAQRSTHEENHGSDFDELEVSQHNRMESSSDDAQSDQPVGIEPLPSPLAHQDDKRSNISDDSSENSLAELSESEDDHHESDVDEIAVSQQNLMESSFDADMQSDQEISTSVGAGESLSAPLTHENDRDRESSAGQERLGESSLAELSDSDVEHHESDADEAAIAQHDLAESSFDADVQSDHDEASASIGSSSTHQLLKRQDDESSESSDDQLRSAESSLDTSAMRPEDDEFSGNANAAPAAGLRMEEEDESSEEEETMAVEHTPPAYSANLSRFGIGARRLNLEEDDEMDEVERLLLEQSAASMKKQQQPSHDRFATQFRDDEDASVESRSDHGDEFESSISQDDEFGESSLPLHDDYPPRSQVARTQPQTATSLREVVSCDEDEFGEASLESRGSGNEDDLGELSVRSQESDIVLTQTRGSIPLEASSESSEAEPQTATSLREALSQLRDTDEFGETSLQSRTSDNDGESSAQSEESDNVLTRSPTVDAPSRYETSTIAQRHREGDESLERFDSEQSLSSDDEDRDNDSGIHSRNEHQTPTARDEHDNVDGAVEASNTRYQTQRLRGILGRSFGDDDVQIEVASLQSRAHRDDDFDADSEEPSAPSVRPHDELAETSIQSHEEEDVGEVSLQSRDDEEFGEVSGFSQDDEIERLLLEQTGFPTKPQQQQQRSSLLTRITRGLAEDDDFDVEFGHTSLQTQTAGDDEFGSPLRNERDDDFEALTRLDDDDDEFGVTSIRSSEFGETSLQSHGASSIERQNDLPIESHSSAPPAPVNLSTSRDDSDTERDYLDESFDLASPPRPTITTTTTTTLAHNDSGSEDYLEESFDLEESLEED